MPREFTDLVDGDDVVMVEGRCGSCLTEEALAGGLRRGDGRPHDLEGDLAVEAGIFGAVDEAHAAFAHELADEVGTEAS